MRDVVGQNVAFVVMHRLDDGFVVDMTVCHGNERHNRCRGEGLVEMALLVVAGDVVLEMHVDHVGTTVHQRYGPDAAVSCFDDLFLVVRNSGGAAGVMDRVELLVVWVVFVEIDLIHFVELFHHDGGRCRVDSGGADHQRSV